MKYLNSILLVCIFLLASCSTRPATKSIPLLDTTHTIYFIYRGWHTSILMDAKFLAAQNPQLTMDLLGQTYARIGWGDGDYFTGKNKSVGSAAKALIASGYSAVQLLPYDYEPFVDIPAQTIVPLAVTEQGLRQLAIFIGGSITADGQGQLVRLPSYGDAMGSFFKSENTYGMFTNCNTWSGNALSAAGLPISNRLTAQGVFEQAQQISSLQTQRGLFKKRL